MTWVGGGLTLKAGETQSKQESQNKKASCTFMDRESTDATAYRIYAISSNKNAQFLNNNFGRQSIIG